MKVPAALVELHRVFDGSVRWRLAPDGLEVEGNPGQRPVAEGTEGAPTTVTGVWEKHHVALNAAAEQAGVPVELLVAAVATVGVQEKKAPVLQEQGWRSDEETPHALRAGLLLSTLAMARAALEPLGVAPTLVTRDWLLEPANALRAGAALIAAQRPLTRLDPPLVIAALLSGAVKPAKTGLWRLELPARLATGKNTAATFVAFFNDFWRVLATHPLRPAVSFWRDLAGGLHVHLPLGGAALTPARAFHNNETSAGGFFPLGLRHDLHAGIHLHPADRTTPSPVRSVAPGWIVAARLGPMTPEALKLVGNHAGFVLVRHELRAGDGDAAEEHALYSLHMHLLPPAWPEAVTERWTQEEPDGPYREVRWLDALRRLRLGSLVVVDPRLGTPGSVVWPATLPADTKAPSGTVRVHRDHPPRIEELALGEPTPGRALALHRPRPDDVGQALEGLHAGKVVTFDAPYLTVEGGEVLGFVQAPPGWTAFPSGFLHWELFAPANAGVAELLKLAETELGLGAGFFRTIEEQGEAKDLDNFWSTAELNQVLAPLLPDADRAGFAGDLLKAQANYEREVLALFHAPVPLSFADQAKDDVMWTSAKTPTPPGGQEHPGLTGDHTGCGSDLTYPVTLEVENYLGLLEPSRQQVGFALKFTPPAGKGEVRPARKEKTWNLTLQVPAPTERLVLEPLADTWLDIPRGKRQDDLAARTTSALRALLPHRWRHALLRHTTAWSRTAIERSLAKRAVGIGDTRILDLAWWGKDKELPVLGATGKERSVFVDGGLLPGQKVDAVHPITGLWLVRSLLEQRKARLVSAWTPYAGEGEDATPVHRGWVTLAGPVDRAVVGDAVCALVVTRGYGSGLVDGATNQVTLVAAAADHPERRRPLGRFPLRSGVVAPTVRARLWGRWALEVEGHDAAASGDVPHILEVPKPELERVDAPAAAKGLVEWVAHFRDHRPRALEGWVLLRVRRAGAEGEGTVASVAIPVDARPVAPPAPKGLKLDATGQFVVGASRDTWPVPARDSAFTLAEWTHAAGGTLGRVSLHLGTLVDVVRKAYGSPLLLGDLAPDGLSVRLRCWRGKRGKTQVDDHTPEKHARLLAAAEGAGFAAVSDAGDQVEVRVDPPGGGPGAMRLSFFPGRAYRAVIDAEAPAGGEALEVTFGLLFPNGGRRLDDAQTLEVGRSALAQDAAAIRAAANDDVLEVWAAKPTARLGSAGFGQLTSKVVEVGSKVSVQVSAELLGGSVKEWTAARPVFAWKGKDGVERLVGGAVSKQLRAAASISLVDPALQGADAVTFEARVLGEATFGGTKVSVAPRASAPFDARPRLEDLSIAAEGDVVRFTCQARAWPPSKGVALRIIHDGKETPLGAKVVFVPPHGKVAHEGVPDAEGEVTATLTRAALVEALGEGATFTAEVYRPAKLGQVLGQDVEPTAAEGRA